MRTALVKLAYVTWLLASAALAQEQPDGPAPRRPLVARRSPFSCVAARDALEQLAACAACREEFIEGTGLRCEAEDEDLARLAELTELCRRRKLYANDARKVLSDQRLGEVAVQRQQLEAKIAGFSVNRPSFAWYLPGAASLAAGGGLFYLSFSQGLADRAYANADSERPGARELAQQRGGLFIGGTLAVAIGAAILFGVTIQRSTNQPEISALEARVSTLDRLENQWEEYRARGWADFQRNDGRLAAPERKAGAALPPLSIEVPVGRF